MEGAWSGYRGGNFNGAELIFQKGEWSLEWSEKCQRVMSCHVRGSDVVS